MVMPGDNIKMTVELITPIAMEEGLRFAIREGGRTVGAGVVAKILEVVDRRVRAAPVRRTRRGPRKVSRAPRRGEAGVAIAKKEKSWLDRRSRSG